MFIGAVTNLISGNFELTNEKAGFHPRDQQNGRMWKYRLVTRDYQLVLFETKSDFTWIPDRVSRTGKLTQDCHAPDKSKQDVCRVVLTLSCGALPEICKCTRAYRIYSNKRRPRLSAAPPMRLLFEEFRITWKNTISDKGVRSHYWYFRSRYHETRVFFTAWISLIILDLLSV